MHAMGVKGKLWRMLLQSYQNMTSNVVLYGMISGDIHIKRSVRQGSVLGPWLYMMYIHELAQALQTSALGCKVGNVSIGGVLQADDIAIMALTPSALQALLTICETYSNVWRYRYNPVKSKILVFSNRQRSKRSRAGGEFLLYDKVIENVEESVHVGITLNIFQNNLQRMTKSASKIRGGLMAIAGSRASGLSCCTAIKLYKTVVLPRGLYGAELWSRLNKNELSTIERAHRFCLKFIQRLPKRTKTVIVECMVDTYSIETYIDIKKSYSSSDDYVQYHVIRWQRRFSLKESTSIHVPFTMFRLDVQDLSQMWSEF
jgi:hypothetical protein